MAHPLYGAFLKLKRADLHIRSLYNSVKTFIEGDPYGFTREVDPNPGKYLQVVIYRANILTNPPVVEWGTMIGDVIHNLRSALDHLVWQLAVLHSGPAPNPLPRRSPWRGVQFPIAYSAQAFQSMQPIYLWGTDPKLLAEFERLQPYSTGQPDRHPLWVLHELWNIDKHRFPPIVGTLTKIEKFGYISPTDAQVEFPSADFGPFVQDAEVFRVNIISNPWEGEPQMDVYPVSIFDVAFEEGPPAYGGRVIQTVNRLYEFVTTLLMQFQSEFPQ